MKRNTFTLLFIFLNFVFLNSTAQFFPNPATLSTGQGTPGAQDPLWLCSPWSTTIPGNPMGETFGPTLINNNCAPGAWVDPASLPAPMNNGNWITGTESNCAANSNDGYRYFRLPINLPPDCNGNSVTVQGNYVLNLDGYVDNTIVDVFINGNSQGITGGSFAPGSQLSIYLDGPWVVGQNFIDILVLNYPNGSPGSSNPYGLLLVADGTSSANTDSDGDGMNDLVDVCPCDYGTNQYGCPDPNANTCNIDLIRTTFLNEGCIELPVCNNDCSMYFLNPDPHSGSSAQAYAQTLGANLISVQSAAENSCIMNELNRLGQSGVIWIGFNDEAVEGTFVWYDQAPVTYTNWNAGEPNNAGNENCTQIYPDGLWNDLDCNTANAQSIIEVNLCPLITTNDIIVCTNEPAVIAAEDPILGSHPYTFSWSNGAITQSQTVPSTDASYIVNVIDRYNCSGQDTANVITKPVPVATISPIDTLICTGEVTDFDITSNLANTVFNWTATQTNTAGASAGSGAAISQTLTTTGSVNGTVVYSVTPSLDGCIGTAVNATITVSVLPTINAGTDVSICPGTSTTLTATGGVTYTWDNGLGAGNTHTVTPSATTTYTVTGEDANGCENTDAVTVTLYTNPTATLTGSTSVCLNDANPTVTFSGSLGVAPYVFSYTVDGGTTQTLTSDASGQATLTVATTTAGSFVYELTGVEDANGCEVTVSSTVTVVVNDLPTITSPDVSVCLEGTVDLIASGAVDYTWSPATNLSATTGAQVTFTPGGNTTYTLTGEDANGCINSTTLDVTVLPTAPIVASADVSICPGTPTTISASGGVTYTWDNGLGAGDTHIITPTATTTYTVIAEDANGCEGADAVTVTLYTNPTATLTGSTSVCLNDANPTVTFSGSLGVAPYVFSYTVDGGTTQTLTSDASGQATLTVATTTAGSFVYELTGVEDANGCEVTVSSTVTVVVNDLPTITSPDVSVCLEGTVDLIASGAVDYTWSPATNLSATTGTQVTFTPGGNTTYTLTGEDANGCINSTTLDVTVLPTAPIFASADVSICPGTPTTISASGGVTYDWDNGLGAGDTHTITPTATTTYTVIGEDANGCEGTDAVTVTLYTNPTAVLTGDATICLNDATPTLTFSGSLGVAPYVFSYTINGGTTQTLTSDASGQATLTVATTTAGSFVYELTGVEDANGCEVTVSSTVTVVVNDLPTITSPDVSVCLENTIDLIASGAVDYAWSPATNLSATTGTQVTFTPGSTTTYTVTGEDANGCINSTTLDVTVLPTANIIASADVSICPGTPTTISASGGVTYTWDNGLGAGDTHTITPTATTTYTVIGEDANGCEGTDAVTVTLYTNPTATLIGNAVVCLNDAAPTLTFSGNSGLAPYIFSYTMNGGAMQTVTSNTAGQITVQAPTSTAGNYIYTLTGVEDANGCNVPLTQTVTVVVNNLPTITSASASVCLNETVQLSANGAVNYTWSPATSLSSTTGAQVTFTAGSTGTYTVTGTDANGCVNSTILNVTVLPLPAIDAGLNITGCENDQITLTATGAGPGGNYVWSDANVINGVPFPAQIGLNVYTVTGTDANGCENQDAVTVDIQALPVVSFYTQQSQYCYPVIADFINTTASSQNCTWTLDNGQTFTGCLPTTYVFNQPGVYGVTLQVESTYGCVNQLYQDSMVIVDAYPNAAFTYTPAEITTLHPLVNFTNTSTNATSYIWSFGDGSSITSEVSPNHLYSEESSGTYLITLIAISENGCIDSTSTLIKIDEEFLFFMPNAFTPDGNQHNQTIKPVFTSGIDPFDYTLLIFNRWGEAIFESHDVSVGWDGTYDGRMSQQGTYTWKIEVKTSMSDERKSFVGHLNLLK